MKNRYFVGQALKPKNFLDHCGCGIQRNSGRVSNCFGLDSDVLSRVFFYQFKTDEL